jgi:hypothetical protein
MKAYGPIEARKLKRRNNLSNNRVLLMLTLCDYLYLAPKTMVAVMDKSACIYDSQ